MTRRIPAPRLAPKAPPYYPRTRAGVLEVAESWYEPSRVAINEKAIAELPVGTITPPPAGETNLEIDASSPLSDAAEFAIAMGAINHMFWSIDEQGQFVRYTHNGQVGAVAMSAAFENAWSDPDSPIRRARVFHEPLTVASIQAVFGDIPDPTGRARILNQILLSNDLAAFGEEAEALAEAGGGFDTTFAARLADAFPDGYADEVLKKAQLATSAIWRSAVGRGYDGEPASLTAFADYQIPRVLRAMGLLDYAPDLAAAIDAEQLIPAGSRDEQALRAAAILGIEKLAEAQGVGVADVDYWVWLQRKLPKEPFHLTLTTDY